MAVADTALQLELRARLTRAELRVLGAFIDLIEELDRLDDAAHR